MWHHKDPEYQRAIDVILEIRQKFQHFGLDYIEKFAFSNDHVFCWKLKIFLSSSLSNWKLKFDRPDAERTRLDSVFPEYTIPEPEDRTDPKPDYKPFELDELSWLSIGTFIANVYEQFEATTGITYQMTVDELLRTPETATSVVPGGHEATNGKCMENIMDVAMDTNMEENSNSNTDCGRVFLVGDQPNSAAEEENDSTTTKAQPETDATATAPNKPKQCRRRGSDLSFLEQWGWHKNKRYVTRKKSHDRNDPDTTVNGILRRFLSKHFECVFSFWMIEFFQ